MKYLKFNVAFGEGTKKAVTLHTRTDAACCGRVRAALRRIYYKALECEDCGALFLPLDFPQEEPAD